MVSVSVVFLALDADEVCRLQSFHGRVPWDSREDNSMMVISCTLNARNDDIRPSTAFGFTICAVDFSQSLVIRSSCFFWGDPCDAKSAAAQRLDDNDDTTQ